MGQWVHTPVMPTSGPCLPLLSGGRRDSTVLWLCLLPAPAGDVHVLQATGDTAPPSANTRGKEPPKSIITQPAGLEMRLLQVSVPIPVTIQSGSCFSACSRSQAAVSSPVMHRLHQCIICPLSKICMLLHLQEALRTESTHASLSATN